MLWSEWARGTVILLRAVTAVRSVLKRHELGYTLLVAMVVVVSAGLLVATLEQASPDRNIKSLPTGGGGPSPRLPRWVRGPVPRHRSRSRDRCGGLAKREVFRRHHSPPIRQDSGRVAWARRNGLSNQRVCRGPPGTRTPNLRIKSPMRTCRSERFHAHLAGSLLSPLPISSHRFPFFHGDKTGPGAGLVLSLRPHLAFGDSRRRRRTS